MRHDDGDDDNVVSLDAHKAKKKDREEKEKAENKKQADIFISIAGETNIFHSAAGVAYADILINGRRETWPVRGKGFRRWIVREFYQAHHTAPSSEALQKAISVIDARAHYDGERIDVGLRVAGQHGLYYIDLGDELWQTVEIGPHGWQTIDSAPVRFRRAAGMVPLPVPARNGDLGRLRHFMNVNDSQFVLAVAWLLAALRPDGPYPVLALAGEQGSAKSTLSKLLRWLIDPNSAPLRSLPREDRDLFIAANNGHVLVFDNVSGLPMWISDTICRLSTGGGFSTRTLYSDQEETLFDAQRPIILNGIEDIVERPDLPTLVDFMENRETWVGPAKQLLAQLTALAGEKTARHPRWPKTGKAMGGQLRRLTPSLKQIGLMVKQLERDKHSRPYLLEWKAEVLPE
jgi:hypothetical protein